MDRIKAVGTALLFLGTVAGFALGAYVARLLWLFGLVVVVAVLWAYRNEARLFVRYLLDFRRSKAVSAGFEERIGQLEDEIEGMKDGVSLALEAGREEGRTEVVGAFLSAVADPPQLVGVEVAADDGQLLIVARADPPRPFFIGTRYQLSSVATGTVRGVLTVSYADELSGRVLLAVAKSDDEPYWKTLKARARLDASCPPDVRIESVRVAELGLGALRISA